MGMLWLVYAAALLASLTTALLATLLVALAQECCRPQRGRVGDARIARAHAQLQRMAVRMARLQARLRAHELELQVREEDAPLRVVAPQFTNIQ